jgi:hypothetical protein
VSQKQSERSSGLGWKIGGILAVVLVCVVYLALPRPEPASSAPDDPPAAIPGADKAPKNPFQAQEPGGLAEDGEIDSRSAVAATPIQRPNMGAKPAPQNRDEEGQRDNSGRAEIEDTDPEDLPTLKQIALSDPDPERRVTAVTLLGVSENPDAIPILAQALADESEDVRIEAVLALADFVEEAPVEALEIALSDPSPDVRYEALDVLSDIETPEAYQAMKRVINDPDDDVRELAELLSELYADEDYAR